jgi:NAD(P)-dependent dehydrogenase (short-subunit alcohol dehydrogenase family)
MAARFDGKVAFITGGASGIGKALGEAIARRGAEVVLADRQVEAAGEVASAIEKAGGRARGVELDVRDPAAFERVVAATFERSGAIDLFFNNAGIGVGGEMANYRLEDWHDVLDVNLRGVAHGVYCVYPRMCARGSGHIINTASMAGLMVTAGEGSYAASKYAVVAISRALRVEARHYGVQVSALCPGAIRTPILTGGKFGRINVPGATPERIMEFWERLRPMDPDTFAERVLDAVAKNVAIIVVPRWWKALWYLDRLSPSLSEALTGRMYAGYRKEFLAAHAATELAGAPRDEPSVAPKAG